MSEIITVGLDLAKNVFQAHGADASGRAPVLDPGRKATKSGFFWAVVADDRGHGSAGPPIVLFHYAPGRGKAHPLNFLAGYQGRFLQCDAYQSYNALTEIARDNGPWQLVYCWTHVRRRFVSAMPVAYAARLDGWLAICNQYPLRNFLQQSPNNGLPIIRWRTW